MSAAISGAMAWTIPFGDPAHGPAELLVAARGAAVQQHERVVVLGDPAEVGAEAELGAAAAVGGVGRAGGDGVQHARPDVVEQGLEQLALGLEVLVQHGLGDAGGVGDVVHRRVVVPGAGEHVEGDVEQLLAAGGGGQARRHRAGAAADHLLPNGNRAGVVSRRSAVQMPRSRSSRSAALTA